MNRAMKAAMNSGSDSAIEAASTSPAPTAMPTKFTIVTRAPPKRSARRPPTGRISDPISGPRNVSDAALMGVSNVSANCTCSTWPKAKLKPMNDPNVPM